MSRTLRDYATAQLTGGWGWRARHEEAVVEPATNADRYIHLAAHYNGLLDELVTAVGGPAAVLELLAAVLELLDARAKIAAIIPPPEEL